MRWFDEEVQKYENKSAVYNGDHCTIKRVFWNDTDEVLEFYLESDSTSESYRLFEKDIVLI